jgi:hypothetical protein
VIYRCCLCDTYGEIKEGRIKDGEHVPLCAVHRSELRWKRQPADSEPSPLDLLLEMFARAALLAAG